MEFSWALQEHSLIVWGLTDGAAKNMAKIVQLRLLKTKRGKGPEIVLPQGEPAMTEDQSIYQIIGDYRKTLPPVPRTNFEIQEEN